MARNREARHIVAVALLCVACLGLSVGAVLWQRHRPAFAPQPLPDLPTAPPYTPWPTPPIATTFDFPLLPAEAFTPYVQGVSGPLAVDTRYGVQNPAMGSGSNCFRDAAGDPVPFNHLYHAGIDLFGIDGAGRVVWGQATHAPVHAVADGVVLYVIDAGTDGYVIITEHRLRDGGEVASVYWHVDQVQVRRGQPVTQGQVIAVVLNKGHNSHLHWEMRTFSNGTDLFPEGTAGERGTCNGHVAGVGYTWDDDPLQADPSFYGYLDPVAFVETYQ